MTELIEFAGAKAYVLLLLGMAGGVVGLAAVGLAAATRALRPALMLSGLSLAIGTAALVLGFWGRSSDRQLVFRAVAHVAPEDRAAILAGGNQEAQASLTLGGIVAGPLMLLSAAAIGAAFARSGGAR